MSWRQLPNAITLGRIALVPVLVWLMRSGEYRLALAVGAVAALSDAVDGFLAKRYGWQTRLGAFLDPLADKLLLAALFVGLWSAGHVPDWLLLLVLGRDLLIVGGAVTYHVAIDALEARPTWLSKLTTLVQIVYVLLLLLQLSGAPYAASANPGLQFAVAALTAASGLDYVQHWSRRAWRARRSRGA